MGATYPAGLTGDYGEQLSISATLASLGLPKDVHQGSIYSPDEDFRLHFNPAILEIWVYDNDQTGTAKWINLKQDGIDLTDRTTTGSGTTLDSFTTSDRLFICFSDVVGGFRVDMTASVNDQNTRVITCEYDVTGTWTSLTESDGTITSTARSLGKDGDVTFTAPTDWSKSSFGGPNHIQGRNIAIQDLDTGIDTATSGTLSVTERQITMDADPSSTILVGDYILVESEIMRVTISSATGNLVTVDRAQLGSTAATHVTNTDVFFYRFECPATTRGYWLKTEWSNTLGTNVEIQDLWALHKNSDRLYRYAGIVYDFSVDRRTVGAIEVITTAGSATLDASWIRHQYIGDR